jgi:magnesium transporter
MEKLFELLESKNYKELRTHLATLHAPDIADAMEQTREKESLLLFRLLPKDMAVEVFSHMEPFYQAEFSQLIREDELRELVDELYFDDKIDYLEEIPANLVKKILQNTPENERKLINQFLNYPDYSAGSIMTIELVDLKKSMTVADAIKRIRRIGTDKETIYTCYVTDNGRKLEGLISLKELILSSEDTTIEEIMNEDFISVTTHTNQEAVADKFLKYDLLAMPVVDSENRLVGIITVDDVLDVMEEEATKDFHVMAGMQITEESYMESSVIQLFKKRFPWLAILMISATLTSAIMVNYEALIAGMAILSANIPMLMGTSGNAGAQASTLMVRSIAVGDVEFEDLFKIIWKEFRVSLLIGSSLAVLNFIRMNLIGNYSILLSVVVSLTLVVTITSAKLIGSTLPMFAKKIGLDPAIMANPMISTILDALVLITYFKISSMFFPLV